MGANDDGRSAHSRNGIVIKRLRSWWRGGQLDRELNAEVRFHIEMETEKYVRQGMEIRSTTGSSALMAWRSGRASMNSSPKMSSLTSCQPVSAASVWMRRSCLR